MGMFDYVNFEAPCVGCGTTLTKRDFQTKDGNRQLEVLEPWEIEEFYALCDCDTWNVYHVVLDGPIPPKPTVPFRVEPSIHCDLKHGDKVPRTLPPRSSVD